MASLTLRPWAPDAPEATSLKDVLTRVHLERGHFRGITEASLQEEIAGEGALELSESEDEDGDDEKDHDGDNAKPTTRDELFKAREAILRGVETAHNEFMILLDSISLQLTHHAPTIGKSSMSPALQQLPLGALGHDIWHSMPPNKARQAQDELIATNVRMEGLQQSADSLLTAANRLEDNVRKETEFWNQMLSITQSGWNICKLPGQRNRLGVTYGFSESAPEFSRRGVAALNASLDGSIALERGIGTEPRALRVTLQRGDLVVGRSKLPALLDDSETTLEARIRHARDSLYDEELYHEMLRESREQASLGVSIKGDGIVFRPEFAESLHGTEVMFELVSLDELDDMPTELHAQDTLAQAIALSARLLLSQAHREKVKKRSAVPLPLSDRKEQRSSLPILRPMTAFLLHHAAIDQVNMYLASVTSVLLAARIEHRAQAATFTFADPTDFGGADDLMRMLMERWTSQASVCILDRRIALQLETTPALTVGTVYTLTGANGRVATLSGVDELRNALNADMASMLAQDVGRSAGGGWKCNVREALLTRADGGGKSGSAWVTFDGGAGVLSLNTPTQKISWDTQDGHDKGLQEAWEDMSK